MKAHGFKEDEEASYIQFEWRTRVWQLLHNAEIMCDLGKSRKGQFRWSPGQLAHWSDRRQVSQGSDKFPLDAFI